MAERKIEWRKERSIGVPKRERKHASFELDALIVVEVDIAVNQTVCFAACSWLMPVETFYLDDGEEFSAIALSYGFFLLDIDGVNLIL